MLRSEYILKIVFALSDLHASIDPCQYGCSIINSSIKIIWDDEDSIKSIQVSKGCNCKSAKCDGTTAGCRNCFRSCKPCTHKCKCKGSCKNPHNNGGRCSNCEAQDESDQDDEQQTEPEMLPLVTRTAETLNCNTDSDEEAV